MHKNRYECNGYHQMTLKYIRIGFGRLVSVKFHSKFGLPPTEWHGMVYPPPPWYGMAMLDLDNYGGVAYM